MNPPYDWIGRLIEGKSLYDNLKMKLGSASNCSSSFAHTLNQQY
ncbi:hypothetical protein ACFFSY_31340 [Paenibacillus aurantiacus]|uniref:Uncharacterized protein n=1 Tax=Paenibacillus aurantiacus TaxID=1936118 RepID=A0ABV5KYZ8_9BACL